MYKYIYILCICIYIYMFLLYSYPGTQGPPVVTMISSRLATPSRWWALHEFSFGITI